MSSNLSTREVGRRAEALAADYLRQSGYTVRAQNISFVGSELDLVCQDAYRQLVLVEVKSLQSSAIDIYESLTHRKKQRLRKGMEKWLMLNNLQGQPWRCELLGVIGPLSAKPQFLHIKDVEL